MILNKYFLEEKTTLHSILQSPNNGPRHTFIACTSLRYRHGIHCIALCLFLHLQLTTLPSSPIHLYYLGCIILNDQQKSADMFRT